MNDEERVRFNTLSVELTKSYEENAKLRLALGHVQTIVVAALGGMRVRSAENAGKGEA